MGPGTVVVVVVVSGGCAPTNEDDGEAGATIAGDVEGVAIMPGVGFRASHSWTSRLQRSSVLFGLELWNVVVRDQGFCLSGSAGGCWLRFSNVLMALASPRAPTFYHPH